MDTKTELKNIPIATIDIGPRFRQDYGADVEWTDFKKDIENNGLISAIAVKRVGDRYELLAGGRRLQACTELKHETINATIYTGEIDEADMVIIELNENLKRKNLLPREESEGKKKLLEALQSKYGEKRNSKPGAVGVSMSDAARMIGESVANFSRDVQLAEAFNIMPELEDAKTKTEAFRLAKRNIQKLKNYKAVKEIEEKEKDLGITKEKVLVNYYHVEDFFEGVAKVANGIVNLVEIDPPYGIDLREKKKGNDIKTTDYNEVAPDDYEKFMRKVLAEAYRIAKPNAWLILWVAIEPWFESIYQWATDAGWVGRRIPGIWYKYNGQTKNPATHLGSAAEFFFYMRKGQPSLAVEGKTNVFAYKPVSPTKKIHPTERPIEMIQDVLETFVHPGALICVPFLGSGNTILAADNMKCRAWGYDLSQEFKDAYTLRVVEGTKGPFKSYT